MHTLVAVHAEVLALLYSETLLDDSWFSKRFVKLQVFAGAKPLLEKIIGVLIEGLIDTFLSLVEEHRSDDLRSIDANGFCQLMFEVNSLFFIIRDV